jgi:hypothetical protein
MKYLLLKDHVTELPTEKRCVNYLNTHTTHHGPLVSALGEEVTQIVRWSWLICVETQTMRLNVWRD